MCEELGNLSLLPVTQMSEQAEWRTQLTGTGSIKVLTSHAYSAMLPGLWLLFIVNAKSM